MRQISNVYFVMIRGQLFIKKVGLQIKYLQAICKGYLQGTKRTRKQ